MKKLKPASLNLSWILLGLRYQDNHLLCLSHRSSKGACFVSVNSFDHCTCFWSYPIYLAIQRLLSRYTAAWQLQDTATKHTHSKRVLNNAWGAKGLKRIILLLRQQTSASHAPSHCTPRVGHYSKLEETLQAILAHLAKSAEEQFWLREEHALWRETINSLAEYAGIAPAPLRPSQQHEWEPFTVSRGNLQDAVDQNSQEGSMGEKVASLLVPLQQGAAVGEGLGLQGSQASCEVIAHIVRPVGRPQKRPAGEAVDSHPTKQPKLAAQEAIPAQHQISREPCRAPSHEQSLTAVDIAQQWLDHLTHSSNAGENDLVEHVAEGLCNAVVFRQCPVRCVIAGTVSAIIECAALSGIHSGPMTVAGDKSASSTSCDRYLGAISMQAGMSIEDLAFCNAWYEEQPRVRRAITLLVMCMMRLQKLLKGRAKDLYDGGAEVLQELHKELRRCLNLKRSTRKEGAYHETKNCALCASLALVCRITGNIQVCPCLCEQSDD